MSGITAEMPVLSASALGDSSCLQCGSELAEDQEWCLECGAARTLIHRPPDWRIPAAIVATVVLLVLAGFAIALVDLSSSANDSSRALSAAARPAASPAPTPAASPAAVPVNPTAPAVVGPKPLGGWPVGLSGWTVILFKDHDKAKAAARARQIAATGLGVGLLDSNQHPSLIPGYWVVFSGRYPDKAHATAATVRLKAHGNARARARQVARPGGL
jgi:hypothetical protein